MIYFKNRLLLLKQPALRNYTMVCALSTFGSGLTYVTMNWMILKTNNSISATSLLMICFFLPAILCGPLFGVMADRYSRKTLIMIANASRAIILFVVAYYVQNHLSAFSIYVIMFLMGITYSLYLPASVAITCEIVYSDDLLYANATLDMAYEAGSVIGTGSAGFFISIFSISNIFLISGVMFTCSVIMMCLTQTRLLAERPIHSAQPYIKIIITDFKLGIAYLKKNPILIVVYSIQLLILTAFMISPILLAPFAKNVLHASVTQFGEIEASLSGGVIVGGLLVPWIAHRMGVIQTLIVLCALVGISLTYFGFNRSFFIGEMLYFYAGFGLAAWPLIQTKAQQLTILGFQSRMQSIFHAISGVLVIMVYALILVTNTFIRIPYHYFYIFAALLAFLAIYLSCRYLFPTFENDCNNVNVGTVSTLKPSNRLIIDE